MLNLSFIFEDAHVVLSQYADRLAVTPLPATVYMMQADVVNQYRHALTHCFTLTLNESFLQNSSLGNPYQKWAYFVNADFEVLSLAAHNLLRYTGRLIHEVQRPNVHRDASGYRRVLEGCTNAYVDALCDIKYRGKSIGVRVRDDERVTVTSIRTTPHPERLIMRGVKGGPPEYVRLVKDATGQDREEPIDVAEWNRAREALEVETVHIQDRSQLEVVRERGAREIEALAERNRAFGHVCNAYYASHKVAEPFRNLMQDYLV